MVIIPLLNFREARSTYSTVPCSGKHHRWGSEHRGREKNFHPSGTGLLGSTPSYTLGISCALLRCILTMRTEYPAKILIAWGEAISGHRDLRDWLTKNGYPELGIFVFALNNKDEARKWLMANGHQHLMAIIRGIEGDKVALEWLERNGMKVLQQVALTGDHDDNAFHWLLKHDHRELAMLGLKMRKVKAEIEDDNRDPHKYPKG